MGRHFLPVSNFHFGWHTRSACSVGSSPTPTANSPLVQWPECLGLKTQKVGGSNPSRRTNFAPVAQLVERKSRTEYSQDVHNLQEGGRGGERVCLFLFRDEQSSEHRTNNSVVGGSSPSGGTISVE